jgi:hypothetical protein
VQKKTFGEKLKKFWRGLVREFTGESNRIIVPVPVSHYPAAAYMSSASVPNPDNRLEFENSKVVIEGAHRDVHRVRCLDNMIGKLSQSFNEKAQKKIQLHIADVADSLQNIRAYKITADQQKTPVEYLEYSHATIKI